MPYLKVRRSEGKVRRPAHCRASPAPAYSPSAHLSAGSKDPAYNCMSCRNGIPDPVHICASGRDAISDPAYNWSNVHRVQM
jgi:hypothetical protein